MEIGAFIDVEALCLGVFGMDTLVEIAGWALCSDLVWRHAGISINIADDDVEDLPTSFALALMMRFDVLDLVWRLFVHGSSPLRATLIALRYGVRWSAAEGFRSTL